jgi:exonuclease III
MNGERKWLSDYFKLGFVDGIDCSNPQKPGHTWHNPERGYKPGWHVAYVVRKKVGSNMKLNKALFI